MNQPVFFVHIRHTIFGGNISPLQMDGINRILSYRDANWPAISMAQLAYILATANWESGHTMRPIQECGSAGYLRGKPYWPWIGEGLIQVTWEANYRKFGATKPGDLLQWPLALRALFQGMMQGMFTGKSLPEYVSADGAKKDYLDARRVVNGTDKARIIATLAESFLSALNAEA
jgi:hypothetical protein